jgi:LysM repeat protein
VAFLLEGGTMKFENIEPESNPNLSRKPQIVFVSIGAALIVLIALAIMFLPSGRIDEVENQVRLLEAKLKQTENRLIRLDKIDKKLADIDEKLRFLFSQYKQVEMLKQRPERLEGSVTRSTDKTPDKKTKARYHQVKAGETLYAIGRRYGLKIEELRRLNKLAPGAVIHPGQKLVVGQ